jgi:hypothetical protein
MFAGVKTGYFQKADLNNLNRNFGCALPIQFSK